MNFYTAPCYTRTMLEQLDESEVHFPFTDEDAVYDGFNHQYRLTADYFYQRGRNLVAEIEGTDPEKVRHFLKYLQMKVYNYIYTHSKSTRPQLNYMIAKRGVRGYSPYQYRQAFLEAMYLEGCYLLDNGDLSQVSGVDLDTMQNMSEDVMRRQDRDFNRDAIRILLSLGLNYYGKYTFIPQGTDW